MTHPGKQALFDHLTLSGMDGLGCTLPLEERQRIIGHACHETEIWEGEFTLHCPGSNSYAWAHAQFAS
jgi:hypothetical protein